MKKFINLIKSQLLLQKNTSHKAAKELSIPTVNRRSTDGQSQREAKAQVRFIPENSPIYYRVDSVSILSRQSDLDQVRAVSVGLSARVWKHVAMIFAVLVMSIANIGMAWADTELANINFKSWTPQSISAGSTVNGCYFKSAVTITAANGATFSGKASTSSNWVAIPLSGINGSITITLTHASGRPQWGNYLKGLNAAPSSSDLSSNPSSVGDNTRPGSNTTTSSWTINTDKLYGVFYVGKGSNGLNDIYSITITTPDWTYYYRGADNSWGGTAMTNSSAGFYSYKSSTTNNHQFKIAKSADGWDYNYSFVDAGYLGTSITTIGDYGSDNCYIWSAPASYYIIVFRPGSPMNTTASPKICASATLPAEKFTISFNNGGGSGSMSSLSNVLYGSDKATTANTFTKDGYRFTGWHANVDVKVGGATKTAGTLLDDEVTIQEIKSDITLTAQWEVDDGCNKIFWFSKAADATTNGVTNNTTTFSGVDAGSTSVSGSITIDGKTYSVTGRGSNNATAITFTVPANKVGTLYGLANSSGSSARTLTLTNTDSYSKTQSTSASSSAAGAFTFTDMPAGSYSMAWSGNGAECMLCLKLCDAPAGCTAPTGLSAGSLTAKGATFTVTDGANTNNYEFYVSKSSTAPTAETEATYTSTSKTKAVTDLVAGTKYYAWVRSKCSASNKSDWVSGGNFTTNTVTVTHTLTNVTETSGAATSGVGGSDYTAVFAADAGYSLPTPSVTIDGNAASSGTDYTWTAGTGTLTIPANKINGNIVITLNSAAAAPSSVAITGNWLYFAGETIELTATPTGGNGPVTYQWYKGGKENGNAIEGATTATYTKATCAFDDAGSYYCKVTCGGSESTWGQNGDAYDVKIPRLYVKTGRNDGLVKEDHGNVDFTRVDASTATASISLGSNWDYCFNIADGCGHYYGNAGTMQYNNYGPWTTNVNNQDCGLRTTNGATYVFTINYSNWTELKTTVTFPSSNQAADKVIYFDNNDRQWSNLHYRIGRADHTQAAALTLVPGTANLYKYTTVAYNNFAGWHIANNAGWTGSNTIYRTYTNGDEYSITYATAHEGGAVTQAAVTVTPTTSRGAGSDVGINDNCTFYNYEITTGMKTQNVSITAPTNGTITVSYTDVNNAAQSFTSGNADLAHTVIITPTVTPATGYQLSGLTVNGNAHTPGNTYTVTGTTVVAATFSLIDYTVTLNTNGGTINAGNVTSYNYGTGATLPTNVTKDGYIFDGWFDNSGLTGSAVTTISSSATGNKEFWAKWTACSGPSITAFSNSEGHNYNQGDVATTMTVTAAAGNGGTLHYHWYQYNVGQNPETQSIDAVGGTDANTYTPSTASAHEGQIFYCVVSEEGCSTTVKSAYSGAITVIGVVDPCSEPSKVTNEIARFFVPCGLSNATSGSPTAWTVINEDASTGDNTFTTSGFGGGSSNWYRNETSGLIYGKLTGNSSYIIIKLKSGNFQAGDVVTAYFNRNDATKTGLTLHTQGSSYAIDPASTAAGVETSGTYTLVADAIEADGSIKLFRANSSTYVNRIIVTRAPVGPSITATKTSPDYVTTDPGNLQLSISTTGASSGWYYRVKNTGNGGYQTPDNTPYNTATWTMTSGLSLGANNFVVELYNGSGVKQAESGIITVTAETAYPITIAAGAGGSVSPSGEIKANESGNHIHPAITATPSSGYHFVNWTLNNANATLANASSATTTITNAIGGCTITANFEADDACPAAASGEVVYKFVTKSSGLGTSAICAAANTDYPLTTGSGNPLETLTNGSLTARASSAGTTQLKYNTSSINFNGGSSGWLIIGLDCPIKSGDVIRYVNNNSGSVAIRTAKGTSENEIVLAGNSKTEVQTVVVSAEQATAFNELTTVYMVRKSNTSDISYFEIIRPYVITLDANTNGGKVNGENTEVHYMLSGESLVLPHATKSGGYRFKGWFTTSDGATQASTIYSPTGTTTLYAQFEDCPGSGTVYKWEVASGLTNGSVTSNGVEFDFNVTNDLSTLIGGTLITDGSKASYVKIADDSKISIEDNGAYLKVDLDCALEAGDKFVATVGSHTAYVTAGSGDRSSAAKRAELPKGTTVETAVPAALEGASTLYIWKGDGNCKISYFEITRTSTTYTVSYDANGGTGTAPTDGTAYARNAEVTVKDNTGSLTKSNYAALAYWNTKDDGTGTDYAISTGTFEITSDVTLYAKWTQAVTFDANTANHGSTGGSATAVWNATGLTGITHATPASGYKLLGYYTTASGDGVKVINSDGTFAATNVTDYITSGKWSRTGAAPTLYARYESSGSLIWNLGVNTDATSLTTSSKNSDFPQIAVANMTNAALTGISYSKSKKSELTGIIETPTSYDGAKYVSVTFQVAAGYKFTPSSVNVKVQPKDNAKTVKLELSDASSHSQNYTSGSQEAGSIHTVTMTGNGTFYTGTVTLKIYCYGASGGYRLGTPISIEGEVEATCTMPSFDGLNYEQTSYSLEDDASAITVTNPANVTTCAWKQNTTNDRSGTTPASGTNNTASYTPPTSAAGTLYYWCELTNDCGTVKTPAVGITVSATKSDATISWTGTSASANYGGGGYTVKATVNETGWNGNEADLTLSAPAGIRIYSIESGTADGKKYVQASFDVTTAFDRETYSSTIPFTVSADATATYNSISDEHAVSYEACTGAGEGDSYNIRMRKVVTKDGNYYHCANTDGWISANISSSHSTTKASSTMATVFDTVASSNTQYVWVRTYHADINKVRIYADFRADNMTVANVYKSTNYFSADSKYAVDYTAIYNGDEGNDDLGDAAQGYVDIELDNVMAANDVLLVAFSTNRVRPLGAVITEGSAGSLTTTLSWSGGIADGGTVSGKTQSSANFTYTASLTGANSNSLGAITYTSSNTSCATVDPSTGEVTITASGSADLNTTITATLAASGCYKPKSITYSFTIPGVTCEVNHGTLSSDVTSKCETEDATLTLTDFESGASVQWYNGETPISNGPTYTITTVGTTSTMVTKEAGTYSVMVTNSAKTCSDRSNSITISNISATASVTKIVDEWYVKNGRLTPDIELWSLSEGATLKSVAWSPANETGLSCVARGGVIYLEGKSPSSNDSGDDIEYTLTATITDECNADHEETTKTIKITHQKNTDKHVLAFVVTGTEKGGFTAGITAAQTTNVGLYNAIAAQFDVQATNIYATDDEKKLKEYYSQYDILCITDYPNTQTKGANSKSYVDAIGSLIDIRPILTMEAFVSKLANWKAKGISGNPKSPSTRQYTMDLQCKDHEIFAGTDLTKVGEGDETMYRVSMVDNTKEDYATLDATYGSGAHAEKEGYQYGKKPALQGFTFTQEMSDNDLLPIGLIDDGAGNPLQVGIERQHNMEARLMVLGINSYAMERLTDDGERVVINALNYLMKKNAEDIADCSTAFVGGAAGDTKNWNNANNWTGNTVPLPSQKVRILAECEVSSTVQALDVLIVTDGKYNHGSDNAAGKLTIKENGALIVGGKIQAASAPAYNRTRATTPDKLLIETSDEHQAALIFDNNDGETQATVKLYSLGRKDGNYQYQYFAIPMEYLPVNPTFANETHGGTKIYTYVWEEGTSSWTRRKYYDDLFAFEGLGITTNSEEDHMDYTMTGNLVSTAEREITLTYDGVGNNIIGNSYTAPINIASLVEAFKDDGYVTKTVYVYCAGRDAVKGTGASGSTETAGQWLAIPMAAASFKDWEGLKVIPAMQAFLIQVTGETSMTLNYDEMVRSNKANYNAYLRAPQRFADEQATTLTRLRVADSQTHTDLYLFEGEKFSEGFDNGWEATYMEGDGRSAQLYAMAAEDKMAVLAASELEGTQVGFAPGQETVYTFSFAGGTGEYYLNDIKAHKSALIQEGNTYSFEYENGDAANRFYISKTAIDAPAVGTGVDNTQSGVKVQKFIYQNKLYILRNGVLYDATGKIVK